MLYNERNTEFLCPADINFPSVITSLENIQLKNVSNLFISSSGGLSAAAEFGMKNLIERRVTTIGGEIIASAALTIFMCGEKRLALPSSIFCFHEAWMEYEGRQLREAEVELKLEMLKHTQGFEGEERCLIGKLEGFRRSNLMVGRLLAKRSRLSYARVRDLMRGEGCFMGAREAMLYGLIHEIIPETIVVMPS